MDNQQERPGDLDLGWLIGVIESEGCLTIQRPRNKKGTYGALVLISNTNPQMIEALHRILVLGGVGHHIRWFSVEHLQKYNRKSRKPIANVTIWGLGRVRALLDLVGPRWFCKGDQARLLRLFVEGPLPRKGDYYEALFQESRALKRYPHRLHAEPTRDDIVEPTDESGR